MVWFQVGPFSSRRNVLKTFLQEKLVTPQEAVECIRSGNNVVLSMGAGEPTVLLDAMVERKDELRDVRIHQMLPVYTPKYMKKGMERHFRHVSWVNSAVTRPGVKAGQAGIMPGYLYEYPRFITESLPVDVFMATVSPMDRHGFLSFGVSVNYAMAAAQKANTVILVVNPNMPRVHGSGHIHICQADLVIEDNSPLPEVTPDPPTEIDLKIAENIAAYIDDRATLELGIGTIPQTLPFALAGKKGLGIHTEILTDAVIELVEKGIVTNQNKTLHPGKIICTSAIGTKQLYDFMDDNPMIEMRPVSYTNDPYVIARNENMVSVNSASEVDLLGQCSAEPVGPKKLCGTGGQVDFARGTALARNGKFFMALRSTNEKGQSNIVPQLHAGAVVSINRNDVDYIATEYGVVKLRGKTVRERAEALISIAHPDYRDGLKEAAKKLGYTR
ncbi:MAG: 4-hydroxybutyrate CoA-transferase [Peptococcaceae bacterium]|nr:4-hydroxybutyrate CoA-transferase [Peptococcaceae bacterium]